MTIENRTLKIAYIPPNEPYLDPDYDYSKEISRWFPYARKYLKDYNILFNVIDAFDKWDEIDLFIFCNTYEFHHKYYIKIMQMGMINRCVYWAAEPSTVMWWHMPRYIPKIKKFFNYVASNKNMIYSIDNTRLMIPELFNLSIEKSDSRFTQKKLLCNISSNKSSTDENELYSERKRIIKWFSDNHPEDFELYGYDWSEFPSVNKGKCNDKIEVYHKFKFALCLENSRSSDIGEVTEKIFDCIKSGIVPIYEGFSDISDFIPVEAYIPYCNFDSLLELYKFIDEMEEEKYNEYLYAAKKYVDRRDYSPFDLNTFKADLCSLINLVKNSDWDISVFTKMEIIIRYIYYRIKRKCLSLYSNSIFMKKIWRSIKKTVRYIIKK